MVTDLPIKHAKIINKQIGVNLVGSERIMDTNGIRHALKYHGSPTQEEKRGQIAVTIDDFARVPAILKEPDKIEYVGKNKLKQDVFLFYKRIGHNYVVAECVRFAKNGNRLVFATLYKLK